MIQRILGTMNEKAYETVFISENSLKFLVHYPYFPFL